MIFMFDKIERSHNDKGAPSQVKRLTVNMVLNYSRILKRNNVSPSQSFNQLNSIHWNECSWYKGACGDSACCECMKYKFPDKNLQQRCASEKELFLLLRFSIVVPNRMTIKTFPIVVQIEITVSAAVQNGAKWKYMVRIIAFFSSVCLNNLCRKTMTDWLKFWSRPTSTNLVHLVL